MSDPNASPKAFLIVLDGFGLRQETTGNAVHLARTPFLKSMYQNYSWTTLSAAGRDVGLPKGLMGNSEVGHLNLGAGRVVHQEISRIDESIERGEFFVNPVILESIHHAHDHGQAWHLIGLISDGGVHSSLEHVYALLETARREGLSRVYLHALMDGRDTPPHSGINYLRQVEEQMARIGVGRIASVCGRYWAMDRDKRWDRVQRAYKLLTAGEGMTFGSALEAAQDSYKRSITDEFIEPSLILDAEGKSTVIQPNDTVFFFNFRADRAREIALALNHLPEAGFETADLKLHYSTLTQHREDFPFPAAYRPVELTNILGQVISRQGLKQFRIAETEKYAHVTFFFNGGEETPFPGEERQLIPSPKVATYDLQPEMSAPKVAEKALEALDKDYSFILLNFANPDMVGHTGVLSAAISALETLDPLVESLVKKGKDNGYNMLLTADHGNCEQMIDTDGGPHTAHTTNRVPLVIMPADGSRAILREDGRLADVAPTILSFLGIQQPEEMTGKTLIL